MPSVYCCGYQVTDYDPTQDVYRCRGCKKQWTGLHMKSLMNAIEERDRAIADLSAQNGELRSRIAELENGPERKKWWLTLKFSLGFLLFVEVWMNSICWEFMSAPVSAAAVLTIIATTAGLVCSFIYEEGA